MGEHLQRERGGRVRACHTPRGGVTPAHTHGTRTHTHTHTEGETDTYTHTCTRTHISWTDINELAASGEKELGGWENIYSENEVDVYVPVTLRVEESHQRTVIHFAARSIVPAPLALFKELWGSWSR